MHSARQRSLTVTQSNALALSSQEMSLLEKRLLAIGIAKLDATGQDLRVRFYINEFNAVFDVTTNANHERLKEGAKLLLSRVVHIEQPEGGWEMFQWVNYARYMPSKDGRDGSYIDIEFSPKLAPYIYQLSRNFNSYTLEKIAQMQSFYSVRVFEILHHDSFAGKKSRVEYDLDDLKFRLRLKYREKSRDVDRYPNYKDFRVRVLEQAQRDCEAHTDLTFTFEGLRRGRRITTVIFEIRRKAQPKLIELVSSPAETPMDHLELADQLREAGFLGSALDTIKEYGVARVGDAIRAARKVEAEQRNTRKPVQNLGGLIVHMLRSGVTAEPPSPKKASKINTVKLATELRQIFDAAQSAACEAYWVTLSDAERERFREVMAERLDAFALRIVEDADWQGSAFRAARNRCLLESSLEYLPTEVRDLRAFALGQPIINDLSEDQQRKVLAAAENI